MPDSSPAASPITAEIRAFAARARLADVPPATAIETVAGLESPDGAGPPAAALTR